MKSNRDSYYNDINYIAEEIRHGRSLLFQRFNYFLIMTSFLIIAFVTAITSNTDDSTLVSSEKLRWLASTISIAGFLLSYLFSIANRNSGRIIYGEIEFLKSAISSGADPLLLSIYHFNYHVSANLVPDNTFGIKHIFDIHYYLWAFVYNVFRAFCLRLRSPSAKLKSASEDVAPHIWLTPMFFAFVWIVIFSVTFIEPPWLLPLVFVYISFYIAIAYAD